MSGFPVYCSNGHPLRDVNDRPCPVCGSNEAEVAMSASSMVAGTGGATMSGSSAFVTPPL